jgi:glycosyltransferase involved in cell wall biosynthesis
MRERTPLLFLSDSISSTSGLGRITRDLATRTHQYCSDVFEVATVGYGGPGSRKFPFPEYHLHSVKDWLCPELPEIWSDFVGDREGILFSIWDLSRLYWLGIPAQCPIPFLRKWVETAKMKKWTYHAIDAEGPNGKLSSKIAETMKGFDRVLDYSAFSSKITGNKDFLPHGIDTTVFNPRDRKESKKAFREGGFQGLSDDSMLIGIVATNQARKNWQLGIETCKILLDRGVDVRLWCHTDILDRYWSLPNLIVDYGLTGRAACTVTRFTDEQMAVMYSACDVTLGIGPEGFGYPIAESLACGTPCVTGSYGAQAEFTPEFMQIEPIAHYYENPFCSKRPVYNARHWADFAQQVAGTPASLPDHVNWSAGKLWPLWQSWLRKGLLK